MNRGRAAGIVLVVAGAAFVVVAAAWIIGRSEGLPDGPEPVVWNRTQCAECRMSVSDRAYAAQLQTADGRVLDFDDPGCLFRYELHDTGPVHAIWFHHVREERWLSAAETGFIAIGPSPMGYDLGAVETGVDGALEPDTVRARFASPDGWARKVTDAH